MSQAEDEKPVALPALPGMGSRNSAMGRVSLLGSLLDGAQQIMPTRRQRRSALEAAKDKENIITPQQGRRSSDSNLQRLTTIGPTSHQASPRINNSRCPSLENTSPSDPDEVGFSKTVSCHSALTGSRNSAMGRVSLLNSSLDSTQEIMPTRRQRRSSLEAAKDKENIVTPQQGRRSSDQNLQQSLTTGPISQQASPRPSLEITSPSDPDEVAFSKTVSCPSVRKASTEKLPPGHHGRMAFKARLVKGLKGNRTSSGSTAPTEMRQSAERHSTCSSREDSQVRIVTDFVRRDLHVEATQIQGIVSVYANARERGGQRKCSQDNLHSEANFAALWGAVPTENVDVHLVDRLLDL